MSVDAVLHIRPMSSAEFAEWQATAVEGYANEVAAARGIALEDARLIAHQSYGKFLPNGLATPTMHLVVGEDIEGARVGILWIGPNPDGAGPAWIYTIEVEEHRRAEGWGRALMGEAERLARADGHAEIGLNVFGANLVARGLYESLGYIPASIQMRKSL